MNTLALGTPPSRRMYARVSSPASTPAIFSATYDSMVVERSGGPSHQFDHVPSSRRRARMSFASLRSVAGSRSPSTCSQKRCSATIVAFDSSSPTHQPSASWSSSSRRVPASIARSRSSAEGLMRQSRSCRDRARAAATPLRTAPSIVTGQPVSTQAPARTTPGRPVSRPATARLLVAARALPCGSRLTRDHRSSAGPEPLRQLLDDASQRDRALVSPSARERRSTPPSNTDAPRPVPAR